jgi:hypothetical protein
MNKLIRKDGIAGKIHRVHGMQVMLDRDLATLYQVDTKVLNQAVKRNADRFPKSFMFQLSDEEFLDWRSQFVTSNGDKMGLRRPPYAFTEQGVAMLSAVLRSETAVKVSIQIMQTFVEMRRFMLSNADMFKRIDLLEIRQLQTEKKVDAVLDAIGTQELEPKQGVFFDGQIFDAYIFASKLIRKAKTSIVLIDNYVDESVLTMLSKRKRDVSARIYCKRITKQLRLDLERHNAQYPPIQLVSFDAAHDRFLILDDTAVYHIGASLKDLGKKWFAFSKIEKNALKVIEQLKH